MKSKSPICWEPIANSFKLGIGKIAPEKNIISSMGNMERIEALAAVFEKQEVINPAPITARQVKSEIKPANQSDPLLLKPRSKAVTKVRLLRQVRSGYITR